MKFSLWQILGESTLILFSVYFIVSHLRKIPLERTLLALVYWSVLAGLTVLVILRLGILPLKAIPNWQEWWGLFALLVPLFAFVDWMIGGGIRKMVGDDAPLKGEAAYNYMQSIAYMSMVIPVCDAFGYAFIATGIISSLYGVDIGSAWIFLGVIPSLVSPIATMGLARKVGKFDFYAYQKNREEPDLSEYRESAH